MSGDFKLEPSLRALAAAFKARGMQRHLTALRVFYAGYAQRARASAASTRQTFSEDDVIEWLRMLKISPFEHDYTVMPTGSLCPTCQTPSAVGFVVSPWTDGGKRECHFCYTRLIE